MTDSQFRIARFAAFCKQHPRRFACYKTIIKSYLKKTDRVLPFDGWCFHQSPWIWLADQQWLKIRIERLRLNARAASENLLLISDIFRQHELAFYLDCGTLLGAIRDRGFIPHDYDTDICIREGDIQKLTSAAPSLIANEFEPVRISDAMLSFRRQNELLDVVLRAPSRCNVDLTEVNFLGTTFLVPWNCEGYLEALYGKHWRIPRKRTPGRIEPT